MIEAVVGERGSASQLERLRAGVLPDAELDGLLAGHLFGAALREAPAGTRLEREDVQRELRRARPGATVTKVGFATEEAQGLSEAEWESLKAIRATLPEGAEAHVVRTVASVQTAADGGFVLRRPLVSLKGRFADREVRVRVALGTGIELPAA